MNITYVWIIIIVIKYSTKAQNVFEALSVQQLTVRCKSIHAITERGDKIIFRKNLQEKRSIFNQIRNIQEIGGNY